MYGDYHHGMPWMAPPFLITHLSILRAKDVRSHHLTPIHTHGLQVHSFDDYTWIHELTHSLGFVDFLWQQIFTSYAYGQTTNAYGATVNAVATPKAVV